MKRLRSFAAAIAVVQSLTAASVVSAVSIVSVERDASAAEVVITDEARQHFAAGVALLKDPDGAKYEDAYREFKAAYAASPSWKILGNLGLCAMKLERDGEAIDAYDKYLNEGGANIDAGEKKQVETDLKTMKTGVARVKVTIKQPGAEITDARMPTKGDRIVNVYPVSGNEIELRIHPGHHVLDVKLAGYQTQTWELDAPPGASLNKEFDLPKPAETGGAGGGVVAQPPPTPEMDRPVPSAVYITGIATGVLVVGGAVFAVMAKGKKSDFDTKNDGLHTSEATTLKNDGERLNHIADGFFAGAAVAGIVTIVLYATRPEVPRTPTTDAAMVTPAVLPGGGGGLVFSGAF